MVHPGDAPHLLGVGRLHVLDVAAGDPGDLLPGRLLERLALLGLGLDLRHGPKPTSARLPSNYYARPMSNLETVRTMLACFSAGDPQGQLDRCTDDVVYEAPYYGLERHGKAALAAMLDRRCRIASTQVSYVVVDDFPTIDPDLVIVEVRGDNRVRGGEQRYQNHYIMFLEFRDGLVSRWREFSNPDVYRTAVQT